MTHAVRSCAWCLTSSLLVVLFRFVPVASTLQLMMETQALKVLVAMSIIKDPPMPGSAAAATHFRHGEHLRLTLVVPIPDRLLPVAKFCQQLRVLAAKELNSKQEGLTVPLRIRENLMLMHQGIKCRDEVAIDYYIPSTAVVECFRCDAYASYQPSFCWSSVPCFGESGLSMATVVTMSGKQVHAVIKEFTTVEELKLEVAMKEGTTYVAHCISTKTESCCLGSGHKVHTV